MCFIVPLTDSVPVGMKALSKRVIDGAEYDSSHRDPPPHCHPGTRIQLRERIISWLCNKRREKVLLWLRGPAGVGKSAVIQTLAESLAESESLGATLFFSRLNDRRDPQRVFTTIAYQLATRIPAYQTYITERIALDPSLLKKGMKEQFRVFISEPFGNKGIGIGEGEGPWAVLLDGLDECEGVEEQCKIVRLVNEFVLRFPNAPLIWVIASRPEPHIVTTFKHKTVAPNHWSEYIPIDSTEACQDVERYLSTSFEAMRERYSYLPPKWPSETQFLKLSNGALGLFVFARTAVRFVEDSEYADPISQLKLLLSVIDRLDVKKIDSHPFALLDALYTEILVSISPSVWCATSRVLGFVICAKLREKDNEHILSVGRSRGQTGQPSYPLCHNSLTLLGTSIILGLELSATYGSLHKLYSVLDIPNSENAHKSRVKFLHASFGDYLTDRARSKNFYIDRGESVDDITRSLFKLYLDKPRINVSWELNSSLLSKTPGSDYCERLQEDLEYAPYYAITGRLRSKRGRGPFKSEQDRSECLDAMGQVDFTGVCRNDKSHKLIEFLAKFWKVCCAL